MLRPKITDEHRAIIASHVQSSLNAGIDLPAIHAELLEVFNGRHNYSLQQITATTSWILSQSLSAKRVNAPVLDLQKPQTNEDTDFNNQAKNDARHWQIQQLLEHTSQEQRSNMRYILLPGKNDYDLQAFTEVGIQGKNLLTYILPNDLHAVSQYVQNCRNYGVVDRRIGQMIDEFPRETVNVHGAYIDYFGQFSPSTISEALTMPIDPNTNCICIGYNLRKGREHRSSKEMGISRRRKNDFLDFKIQDTKIHGSLLSRLLNEYESGGISETGIDTEYTMKDLRDELVYNSMFREIGCAVERNWVIPDSFNRFLQSLSVQEDFKDLPQLEKFALFKSVFVQLFHSASILDDSRHHLGIYFWMSATAASVARATVNSPIIHHLSEPFSYVSEQSKSPYRSYFGVLETRRNEYEKYIEAMDFMYTMAARLVSTLRENQQGLGSKKVQCIMDFISVKGVGSKKRIQIFARGGKKVIAEIHHDYLLEAQQVLGVSGCSVQSHDDTKTFAERLQTDLDIVDDAKVSGELDEEYLLQAEQFIEQMKSRKAIGRNGLCPCGSGKKSKKCCMRNN